MNKKRFPGGTLEVHAQVIHGVLKRIQFFGDYMALEDCDAVSEKMEGCVFDKKTISERLDDLELQRFFGAISQEDIIDLLFPKD